MIKLAMVKTMPKFIFAADLHLRKDKPICRKETDEEWMELQRSQLEFITKTCSEYRCPLLLGGDIFHHAKSSDEIKNMFIKTFSDIHVFAIAGQHDLPNHSWENINKSSYGVLLNSGILNEPKLCNYKHYGCDEVDNGYNILLIHELIFESEKHIPPNVRAKTADQILTEYPSMGLILCGDQHHGFHYVKDGRLVIMAGCMNRQAADFKNYEPCIWFVDTEESKVVRISIPDNPDMVSDDHIQDKNDKTDRIRAFVELIKDSKTVSLDFDVNVARSIVANPDLGQNIINVIEELMNMEEE
jgi:hypothetical protein